MTASEAAALIRSGMTIALGGNVSCGYPKAVPAALCVRAQCGEDLHLTLLSSSQLPPQAELAAAGALTAYAPLGEDKLLRQLSNNGQLHYVEQQMNRLPRLLRGGAFGALDIAVVEASVITENGGIVPTNGVGFAQTFLDNAHQVIVELNTSCPVEIAGLHDIAAASLPPYARSRQMTSGADRIGANHLTVDLNKIAAVVQTDSPDHLPAPVNVSESQKLIAEHLTGFLTREYPDGKLPPLQTGFGGLAAAILEQLSISGFRDLEFFCGVAMEQHVRMLLDGVASTVSASAVPMSSYVKDALRLYQSKLQGRLFLRGGEIVNSGEYVARTELISLNSGIESDIYGNLNASHIGGAKVVNGLGGGANFAQNAELSVVLLPSVSKGGTISGIVPMVPHQDICEHDVDVLITEQGCADLRGLDDRGRAERIIDTCAHPDYRQLLWDYYHAALSGGGHHPVDLKTAFSFHQRLANSGSMR